MSDISYLSYGIQGTYLLDRRQIYHQGLECVFVSLVCVSNLKILCVLTLVTKSSKNAEQCMYIRWKSRSK